MTTHDFIAVRVNSIFYLKETHKTELLEPRKKETELRNCVEVNSDTVGLTIHYRHKRTHAPSV